MIIVSPLFQDHSSYSGNTHLSFARPRVPDLISSQKSPPFQFPNTKKDGAKEENNNPLNDGTSSKTTYFLSAFSSHYSEVFVQGVRGRQHLFRMEKGSLMALIFLLVPAEVSIISPVSQTMMFSSC
jgi:hypothetical protein